MLEPTTIDHRDQLPRHAIARGATRDPRSACTTVRYGGGQWQLAGGVAEMVSGMVVLF